MAELCKKCFIETWRPSEYDIAHIIMSDDWDICEGCENIGPYVDHIGSDEEVYSEVYKQMLKENSENTGLNIFDLMEKNKMEIVDINMKIEKNMEDDFDAFCKETEEFLNSMTPEEFFDYLGIPIEELPLKSNLIDGACENAKK